MYLNFYVLALPKCENYLQDYEKNIFFCSCFLMSLDSLSPMFGNIKHAYVYSLDDTNLVLSMYHGLVAMTINWFHMNRNGIRGTVSLCMLYPHTIHATLIKIRDCHTIKYAVLLN